MHADLPHDAPQRLGWLPGWLARGWLSLLAGWLAVAGWLAAVACHHELILAAGRGRPVGDGP